MKKSMLKNTITFIGCLLLTYVLFYTIIVGQLYRFMNPSTALCLGLMIFTTEVLYIFFSSIINRKVSRIHINILMVMYWGITIVLSFFKTMSNINGINLNPLNLITDFKNYPSHTLLLVVTNTFLYFPLGISLRLRLKSRNFKLFIGFFIYILLIEALQYVSQRGIFDINDIILNSMGFFLGVLCSDFIMRFSTKEKTTACN